MTPCTTQAFSRRCPMTVCNWCGDRHSIDQLCQRAQRGMTRRSFCFLFGAGIVGAMLPAPEQSWTRRDVARWLRISDELLEESAIPFDQYVALGLRELNPPIRVTGYFDR